MAYSRSAYINEDEQKRWVQYQEMLNSMSVKDLAKELLSFLDLEEETDSGRVFHPIKISSCRVLMNEPLDMLLSRLRKVVNE